MTTKTHPDPNAGRKAELCSIWHPDYYLWDSWCHQTDGIHHLYSLAVERKNSLGRRIQPEDRNQYPFHYRHFVSDNLGKSWEDRGRCLRVSETGNGYMARNVWSGSIATDQIGNRLTAFTAIAGGSDEYPFVQSMAIGYSGGDDTVDRLPVEPLSCPVRDREQIIAAGYYLGPGERLGHKAGEGGGPIMAWRDPFIWRDDHSNWHIVWSAKSSPTQGVVGYGTLDERDGEIVHLNLKKAFTLPENDFTQIECPKVYFDRFNGGYYLLVATCNRVNEQQANDEVERRVRLYRSKDMSGLWEPVGAHNGIVPGTEMMYGITALEERFEIGQLYCIGPLDERAGDASFGFSKPFTVSVNEPHR